MIDKLVDIATNYVGITPVDDETWQDVRENLETEMREMYYKEKYKDLVDVLKDPAFVEQNKEVIAALKELLKL